MPLEVIGRVRGNDDNARHSRRCLIQPRRHAPAGAVANPVTLDHVRRARGAEREVRTPIRDLPTGRLDLGAQPVRFGPIARGTRLGPCVGG